MARYYERRNNPFLAQNIIGRILFTDDVVYKLENGHMEGVY